MANIIRRNEREGREVQTRGRGPFEALRAGSLDPFRVMGELLRWDPFSDLERWGGLQPGAFVPAVDVRETSDAFVFRADLPGVKEDDVDISLTGNRLVLSGRREEETREEDDRSHSYEISYGSFTRAFTLPEGTDPDKVRAEMKDGVLHITVPKRPEIQPRRIALGGKAGEGAKAGGEGGRTSGEVMKGEGAKAGGEGGKPGPQTSKG
jgi:HSP20 family protein